MAEEPTEQHPVSGYTTRLQHQLEHLNAEMTRCINDEERVDLIKWYFANGIKFGSARDDLEEQISGVSMFTRLLSHSRFSSTEDGKYPPHFRIGDPVQVVVNAKNITPRSGKVRDFIWHYKNGEWTYLISENGKAISKRYLKSDLILLQN
jgi:hypothetical protein